MPLNLERLRRSNNARLRQYERFGIRIFTEALKLQAVPNPSAMPMQEAYIRFYQEVFVDSARREYNRIRMQEKAFVPSDFFLNTWREWIKSWVIENLGFLITEVTETTRKRVQAILGEAIEQGLNPTQTQDLLLQEIPDIKRARAIARTESTRANNMGKKRSATEYANQSGDTLYKVWIWGGSREPRLEHVQLQNKPIKADQNFISINGKPMDVPGDRQGGPENTINCSCSVVYISERLARRRYPDSFQNVPITPKPIQDQQIDEFIDQNLFTNRPNFIRANSMSEADERLNRFGNFPLKGISLDKKNEILQSAEEILGLIPEQKMIDGWSYLKAGEKSTARAITRSIAGEPTKIVSIQYKKSFLDDPIKYYEKQKEVTAKSLEHRKSEIERFLRIPDLPADVIERKKQQLNELNTIKKWDVSEVSNKPLYTVSVHENGHTLFRVKELNNKWLENLRLNNVTKIDKLNVSEYGASDTEELFTESLAAYMTGIPLPENIRKALIQTLNTLK